MLLTLINEILDISKAEAGKLTVERAEYDTLTMLREIRLLVIQKAEEKGLELVKQGVTTPEELLRIAYYA